jgi:glycosyltransferase involved in cell wall biosynthesis
MIAVAMKRRGHEVRFLVYHLHDHFRPLLDSAEIPCEVILPCSRWRRELAVRRILRQGWQDVVLAFLEAPSFYAEFARIPRQRWGLVVGERSANPWIKSGVLGWRRQFHRCADSVVCNSHTNRLMLEVGFPFLRRKLSTIYNFVDLGLFRPSLGDSAADRLNLNAFRIVVIGRYDRNKNMEGVAKALLCLKRSRGSPVILVDWFGGMPTDPVPFNRAKHFLAENGLSESLCLHHATRDIAAEFSHANAVGLFSFFEGLPNAVCEGMACGKPIVLSNVCDAGNLVREGKNGFLCDPSSPESMANAFVRLASKSFDERRQMGLESRTLAECLFDERIVVERYERILKAAMCREPIPADCTWPAEVPESAVKTVEEWANGSRSK